MLLDMAVLLAGTARLVIQDSMATALADWAVQQHWPSMFQRFKDTTHIDLQQQWESMAAQTTRHKGMPLL